MVPPAQSAGGTRFMPASKGKEILKKHISSFGCSRREQLSITPHEAKRNVGWWGSGVMRQKRKTAALGESHSQTIFLGGLRGKEYFCDFDLIFRNPVFSLYSFTYYLLRLSVPDVLLIHNNSNKHD